MHIQDDHPIIIFDAACVLCTANARLVLRYDKDAYFRMASMQGATGASLMRENGVDPEDPSTIILVGRYSVQRDSSAVLAIYEGLGFPWSLISMLRLVPAMLRDPVYRWVARNRFKLFGKMETCWVAPPELQDRFL